MFRDITAQNSPKEDYAVQLGNASGKKLVRRQLPFRELEKHTHSQSEDVEISLVNEWMKWLN